MAILAIVNLLVKVSLNCVSTLAQDIASILVKLVTHLFFYFVLEFFYFVLEIKHRKRGILNSQKHIG